MLIAVDRDIDLSFWCAYLACVTMHDRWSWLDALLNRGHRLYNCRLLYRCCCLLLILDTGEDGVTRTIAIVGDALATHLIGQAIEGLHVFDGMAVRRVHRFANARIGVTLDGGLYMHMFFRCQVVGCDEVVWRWLVGVLIAPLLEQGMIQNMLTGTVAAHHSEVVHGLDTRTDAGEQACRA